MLKQRQSNMELLRIIAMLMILMLHYNANAFHPDVLLGSVDKLSWHALEGHFIESFCISAVNIFVLISGYFAIKLSIRSVLNLYIRCFIIGLITYLLYVLITGTPMSLSAIGGRFLALTHNHWWFVISYIGLMTISPILNAGCEMMSRKQFACVVLLLSIVITYFGWWKSLEDTNAGYSLIMFIYLYVVARFIRLHISIDRIKALRWIWFTLYIISSIAITLLAIRHEVLVYTYDSPLTIISAVSLLLFFLSIRFQNRFVNWAAASVFSAYLIQESPYLGRMWLYPFAENAFANSVCGGGAILFGIFTLVTLVVVIAIDQLCVMPVIKWTNKYLK